MLTFAGISFIENNGSTKINIFVIAENDQKIRPKPKHTNES